MRRVMTLFFLLVATSTLVLLFLAMALATRGVRDIIQALQ